MISGGTAAIADVVILYVLTDGLDIWYLISSIIAFLFAFLVSFYLQKFWTFRDNSRDRIKQQAAVYLILGIVNLAVNSSGIYFLVEIFGTWYLLAQIIIGAVVATYNFLLYKFFIFTSDKKAGAHKNILIATGIFSPDIGGPATYTKTLCEELPKFGWEVKVVTYSDDTNAECRIKNVELRMQSVEVLRVSRQQNKLLRYCKYFWQILHLLNWANIVYAQGPVSEGLPVYWACKLRGRKYILKIVGDYAWEQFQNAKCTRLAGAKPRRRINPSRVGEPSRAEVENTEFISLDEFQKRKFDAKTERKRKVEYKVAQNAEKIIVPSVYLKKIVAGWGVAEEKITVIYNAVEFADVKAIYKPSGEKRIVSVGRLVPWKGMEMFIEIAEKLQIADCRLQILIIGDGPQRQALQVKSQKSKVKSQIKFLGALSHDKTLAYMKAADIFALNTGYEGLPHTILEAMYCGTPVITTPVGGNTEVVANGENGLLVDYNNKEQWQTAILKILKDNSLAQTLARNAKGSLAKFNQKSMIGQTIAELNKLIN